MLRGAGGGSKPHRRRPQLRQRQASATAAAELKEASALDMEVPVVASVEETCFTFEFKRGLKRAKKAESLSMDAPRGEHKLREGLSDKRNVGAGKTPMAKQGPERVELTHRAPSIVVRLMGLDTIPRPKKVLDRCQSDVQADRQRQWLSGEAARASSGDHPCNASANNELPALKDVFEVSEMENMTVMQHEVLRSGNRKPHLSSEVDLEFVRQKFMDVKRLSTDEANRNSKEFSEALEILHSKKDVFLEILQDNRTAVSGFSGNILNHSGMQLFPHASAADAAQPFEREILCNVEVGHEWASDAVTDYEEPTPNMLLKEMRVTALKPFERDCSKSKGSGHRSHIVVLQPNLGRKSFTPVLSSQEASQYDRRNGKQCVKSPKQAIMHSAPNHEVKERQRASKETPKSAGRRRSSELECKLAVDSERVKAASASYHETIRACSSTGSSVSRKARKHLSERWQTACQSGSENSIPRGIKTLGEMLELSDRDAAKEVSSHNRSSDPMFNHDKSRKVPANPLGISSKDGWKTGISCEDHSRDGMSRNLPRSKSLPASSTSSAKLSGRRQSASTCRLPILKDILNAPTDESENARVKKRSPIRNAKQKKRLIVHAGKENMLPEKEIHVTSEKERHSICLSDLPRAANTYIEYPDDRIRSRDQQTSEVGIQHEQQSSKYHMGRSDGKLTTSSPETEENKTVCYEDFKAFQEGINPSIEIDVAEGDTKAVQSEHIASKESCGFSSPSTGPQQSSGEYMSYSGIFNSINVGIQGLREQLKMLKTEDQDGTCGYYSDTLSTDECSNMNTSLTVMEEQVLRFRDEEDRDFSYLQDMLDNVCDFPASLEDWQVSLDVFQCLEHKYNKLLLWSKSDRKLLFDLVNSVIADMTAPSSRLHSKIMVKCVSEMEHGHFTKYVWKMVQRQRYDDQVAWDCILPLPLDHRSESELIALEAVKMIYYDIVEETVVDFKSKN